MSKDTFIMADTRSINEWIEGVYHGHYFQAKLKPGRLLMLIVLEAERLYYNKPIKEQTIYSNGSFGEPVVNLAPPILIENLKNWLEKMPITATKKGV